MPRILLLLLNAVAFGFLLYGLVRIYQLDTPGLRKIIKLASGIILLLAPIAIIAGLFRPTPVYMLIYPLGIGAFIFLARLRD
jgi:hypothetical protein